MRPRHWLHPCISDDQFQSKNDWFFFSTCYISIISAGQTILGKSIWKSENIKCSCSKDACYASSLCLSPLFVFLVTLMRALTLRLGTTGLPYRRNWPWQHWCFQSGLYVLTLSSCSGLQRQRRKLTNHHTLLHYLYYWLITLFWISDIRYMIFTDNSMYFTVTKLFAFLTASSEQRH